MGGCRCCFRDCTVSTVKFPQMHFFRFPLKDETRLEKWIKMTGIENFQSKSYVYQRNRVVCARHFRDECFMNYKRDRLVQRAVPTLMRLSKSRAIDYDLDAPTMVRLPKCKMKHLIPPENFVDCMGFISENEASGDEEENHVDEEENQVDEAHTIEVIEISEIDNKEENRKRTLNTDVMLLKKKRKLLNKEAYQKEDKDQDEISTEEVFFIQDIEGKGTSTTDESEIFVYAAKEDDDIDNNMSIIENVYNGDIIYNEEINVLDKEVQTELDLNKLETLEKEQCKCQQPLTLTDKKNLVLLNGKLKEENINIQKKLNEKMSEHALLKDEIKEVELKGVKLQDDNEHLQRTQTKLRNELSVVKMELEEMKKKYAVLQERQMLKDINSHVTTTAKDNNQNTPSTSVSATPTKAQIFNSIKKYLSASMVALVRMEMFGNAERNWKPDERRTAVDLFNLGESIYRYFTDEWRFRLPLISQVRQWSYNHTNNDDDEDL